MSDPLVTALHEAAARTLEDMCFLCDAPEMEAEFAETATPAFASVRFSGPRTGRLEFRVAQDLLPVIAENMLGVDDSNTAEQFDALGELANVICGNVLTSLGDASAVFDISAPTTGTEDGASPQSAPQPAASVRLNLDYGPAKTLLYVDGD